MKTKKKKVIKAIKPLAVGETINLACGVSFPVIQASKYIVEFDLNGLILTIGGRILLPIAPKAIPSLELLLKRAKATFKKG